MTARHFYKHKLTKIVAPLNDSFAAQFGDRFERVDPTAEDTTVGQTTPAVDAAPVVDASANPANTADAPKEATA